MKEEFIVKWTGRMPLIMHRGELANPFDEYAQRMKKFGSKKTLAELQELASIEWHGSLYVDDKFGIGVPTENVWKAVIEGARKRKLGKQVEAAVFIKGIPPNGHAEMIKLEYPGPQELAPLWDDEKYVYQRTIRVQKSRILRTRPIFRTWALTFQLGYDSDVLGKNDLKLAMEVAGDLIGLGDWRPRYGTFGVEILK